MTFSSSHGHDLHLDVKTYRKEKDLPGISGDFVCLSAFLEVHLSRIFCSFGISARFMIKRPFEHFSCGTARFEKKCPTIIGARDLSPIDSA